MTDVPVRQVRAAFAEETLTVFQAFPAVIAEPAVRAATLVAPFTRERMTWIKPSFLWMMYRSGWATKRGQERILSIEITRAGFEWALAHACLSHFESGTYASQVAWIERKRVSPVRVQWDPDRSVVLGPVAWRAIQVGLSGAAVNRYVDEWIVGIDDITSRVRHIGGLVERGDLRSATEELPIEMPYPLAPDVAAVIGASR
ncbi:MAG: DUF4291 domain-containing protein [Acidimicrobiales bacterium]